jgi:fructan beta-fructosidase
LLFPGANPLADVQGDLFEIEAEIAVGDARRILLNLRGVPVTYNVATKEVSCDGCLAALASHEGKISLHLYVDRASVDIFGGRGSLYMPIAHAISVDNKSLDLHCEGGNARIISMSVYELKSAWQ